MTKKSTTVLLAIVIIILLVGAFFIIFKNSKKAPVVVENKGDIEIFSPVPNEVIVSPLKISGVVRGNGWSGFEGQVGRVKLIDSTGKELGTGILTATEDWMKLPTHFQASIFFDYPGDGVGQLVFYNENASGEPARDKIVVVPVKLKKSSSEKTTVKVYFNSSMDKNSCETIFYAQRIIPKTPAPATDALEQLLMGPTDLEKNAGFSTSINNGVKIHNVTIKEGVATVDLSAQLQNGVAGSCRVSAIRSQITQTLKQFPTVKSVVIAIDNKTDGILQP